MQSEIQKLKDDLEHSRNETESVRAEVRDLQSQHLKEQQQLQLQLGNEHQQRIDDMERRLHEKYEGVVEQRMEQLRAASAEEAR